MKLIANFVDLKMQVRRWINAGSLVMAVCLVSLFYKLSVITISIRKDFPVQKLKTYLGSEYISARCRYFQIRTWIVRVIGFVLNRKQ